MDQVHPCPAAVARRIAASLAEVGGSQLLAVYLHGSAVQGGWVAGRSDVDVLVVAANDIAETTVDSLASTIASAQPERSSEKWQAPKLETSIVTAAAAQDPGPPWPFLRHVATEPAGSARIVRPQAGEGDRDLLMHYADCRAAGQPMLGPPPRDLIGPIPRAEILAYLADELTWGLANAPECYAVLNACRACLYLSDGAMVSKIAGGEAALLHDLGPADVITRALAQQRGAQPDQPPAGDAVAFVEAIAAMLRDGVGLEPRPVVEPEHDRNGHP